MAMRRRFQPRRSFRRFRKGGTHRPRTGIRWQRANFMTFTVLTVNNVSDQTFNTAILMARTMNLGDITTGTGRSTADLVRGIEIGGVVLDYGIKDQSSYIAGSSTAALQLLNTFMLCSDRLDSFGSPNAAASMQLGRTQPPMVQVSAANPSALAEDVDFPLQIHWRKTEEILHTATPVSGEGVDLFGLDGQQVQTRRGTLNKRLRLFLDDYHGLFFVFSGTTGPAYASGFTRVFDVWVAGSIYYRTKF